MTRKTAFAPLVDAETRVLILGSLPGDASLSAGQYYAHPRNAFWQLIGAVIDAEGLPELTYAGRLARLAQRRVGLWDVIASAERAGSLDTKIRDAQPADLAALVAGLPNLRAIGFNGARAATLGRRLLCECPLALIDLPSSSPANAGIAYAEKQRRWAMLKQFVA